METVQPYLDYFSANPGWAIVVIFLIAFGEALLIIGLFVPSTVVLVGAGMLVGSGHLPFWPVFLATSIGAIAGDQISYWAGRFFGNHLKEMWPLNRYPQLVARGEDFVRSHGGKSIAIGRFVPGVKAVVPGIVGMLNMNQLFFIFVNVTSGLFWAAAHVFPGILLGQGLALAGDLSGRLVFVLIELLVILAVASWLIRLFVASASVRLSFALQRLSRWAKVQGNRPLHRFGRAIAPDNPRSVIIVFFAAILLIAVVAFATIMVSVLTRDALPNGDVSVMTFMSELRNAPADQFMIPLTMLGDSLVLWSLMVVIVGWLLWRRAWRAAMASIIVILLGKIATLLLDYNLSSLQTIDYYVALDRFDFVSGHIAVTAITFGVFAVLVSHSMGRWGRAVVVALCSLLVIAIAYSRVYLGVQWFSGALAGLLFGAVMVAAFGVAIEAIPPRRIRPLGLMAASIVTFLVAGVFNIDRNYGRAEAFYAPPQRIFALSHETWVENGWQQIPRRRIDLAGRQEEEFVVQWAGPLDILRTSLASAGWQESPQWTWKDGIQYLDLKRGLEEMAPRPALHQGLFARLTMTKQVTDGQGSRLVLRAFKTEAVISEKGRTSPLFLLSLTEERAARHFHTYAVPTLTPAPQADADILKGVLLAVPGLQLETRADGALTLASLR